jgi:MinD-like ATPase involved in chromosome partitioning or flagellar assembly
MAKIISIHSFRGGTGKSNTTANLAAVMAAMGKRVGVIDTDIQSPGIHIILGLNESDMQHSLNDYLWEKCSIEETAHDVTGNLGTDVSGKVYLIPSSLKPGEITRILREGYDPSLLNEGFHALIEELNLDALLIDTHPGVNEETLLSMAISDAVLIILRPDQQDYLGTGVTIELARRLKVQNLLILVNKAPQSLDMLQLKKKVEDAYQRPVTAIIPHSDEMMLLASMGIFVGRYPDHAISKLYQQTAELLLA